MFRTEKTNPKNLTNVKNQSKETSLISLNTSETSVSLKSLCKQISLSSQSDSSEASEIDIFENKHISEICEFLNECDQKNIYRSKKEIKKSNQQKNRFASEEIKAKPSVGKGTIRFTDLCYEDKKRIGHLISEFARVTEERNALANELKSADNEHTSFLRGGFCEQKEHLRDFYDSAQFAIKERIDDEIVKQKLHEAEGQKLFLLVKKCRGKIRKNKEKFHRKMIRLIEENVNLQQRCDRYKREVEKCKDMLSVFGIHETFFCDRDFKCRLPHYPLCCYQQHKEDERHDVAAENRANLERSDSLLEISCGRKRCPLVLPKKKAVRCSCVDSKRSNVEKCDHNNSFHQSRNSFLKDLLEEEKRRLKATLLAAPHDNPKPKYAKRVSSVQSEGMRPAAEFCDIPNDCEGNEIRVLSAPNSASTVISKKSKLFDNADENNLFEEVFFSNFKDVK